VVTRDNGPRYFDPLPLRTLAPSFPAPQLLMRQFNTKRYSPAAPVNSRCCLPSSMNVSAGLDRPPICEYQRPLPVAASQASTLVPLLRKSRPPAVESKPTLPPFSSFR